MLDPWAHHLAGPPALFRLLPGGPAATAVGTGSLGGAYGETLTFTRATAKVVSRSPSSVVSVASGNPGVDYRGLLIEIAHTNLLLRNRDLTNAAWTKSNATAAKTATGADGTANGASTLTATATNGYAAQAITASGSRTTTVYLRRRTGTGTIAISRNGGGAYTDVTAQVSATYARVAVNSTVTDPEIRIRLGTSGDEIDVDYVQDEAGAYAHSPIETAGASVACNADVASLPFTTLPVARGSVELLFTPLFATTQNGAGMVLYDSRSASTLGGTEFYVIDDTLNFLTRNASTGATTTSSSALTWAAGTTYRLRATWGAGNVYIYKDDVLVGSATAGTANMPNANTALKIGAAFNDGFQADGYISDLKFRAL